MSCLQAMMRQALAGVEADDEGSATITVEQNDALSDSGVLTDG